MRSNGWKFATSRPLKNITTGRLRQNWGRPFFAKMNRKQLTERCQTLFKLAEKTRKFGGPEIQWGDIQNSIIYARDLAGDGPVYRYLDDVLDVMDKNSMIPTIVAAIASELEALISQLNAENLQNG
jgi:hypothetical protein